MPWTRTHTHVRIYTIGRQLAASSPQLLAASEKMNIIKDACKNENELRSITKTLIFEETDDLDTIKKYRYQWDTVVRHVIHSTLRDQLGQLLSLLPGETPAEKFDLS